MFLFVFWGARIIFWGAVPEFLILSLSVLKRKNCKYKPITALKNNPICLRHSCTSKQQAIVNTGKLTLKSTLGSERDNRMLVKGNPGDSPVSGLPYLPRN